MGKFKLIPSGKTLMKEGLPAVGGAIGAKLVKNLAKKVIKKPELQRFLPAVPLLVGAILSDNGKGMLHYAGIGMMAAGGADLAGNFVPVLAGLEDLDLSGIFDETLNDDLADTEDMSGPIDSPLNGPIDGADDYSESY
jgi:hypothetical protein